MAESKSTDTDQTESKSFLDGPILFCLQNKLLVAILVGFIVAWGTIVAPFDWEIDWLPRDPIPVDAIPDIGENQQIVFTPWTGRSPQDIEDQISYPLTVSLLGIPNVKTIRSFSMFGFSSIYIIFDEEVDFYWSRSRVLEKLNSLGPGLLPDGVQPSLGPDATALGQVFWYTLEGHDPDGKPTGGWDLHELRTIQDWQVRYALLSASGISDVSSIGGFVQEYQIDVDPDAMRVYNVTLNEVFTAVRMSNVDVGARTIEVNRVEYIVRGLGFIESLEDIENAVIKVNDHVPVFIKDVANVTLGPALRRGVLDKGGAEAVGGVVVARYGTNPLEAIGNVKTKIEEISPGLPSKVILDHRAATPEMIEQYAHANGFHPYDGSGLNQEAWLETLRTTDRAEWPEWATISQIKIVPFYDRSGLIHETLGTLSSALFEEILVTVIVVLVFLMNLGSSIVISSVLPLAILICFIAMKVFGVDANVVALSGIAIAIGTIVDMGIIVCENIMKKLDEAGPDDDRLHTVFVATREVGSAVLTGIATTIVSFLPVFTMTGAEGKLFTPLAFTKTFVLIASFVVAITIIPPLAHAIFAPRKTSAMARRWAFGALIAGGIGLLSISFPWWVGTIAIAAGAWGLVSRAIPTGLRKRIVRSINIVAALIVCTVLARHWTPLGPEQGILRNILFIVLLIGGLLGTLLAFQRMYGPMLRWCLRHKTLYLSATSLIVVVGIMIWLGAGTVLGPIARGVDAIGLSGERLRESGPWRAASERFPGLGREFMPPLDEGSFLFMPSTMIHASIGETHDVMRQQDAALAAIPEVESAVGKLGRVESPLDPAPISMIETVVNYIPEYVLDEKGHRIDYRYDKKLQEFVRDENEELIPDARGRPYRQWRDHIRTPDDIWDEIVRVTAIPGVTSAPKLQPIMTRLIMLQTGMRAPMGVKVKGPSLEVIDEVGLQIEKFLKEVPSVKSETVFADRIVGKPYIEIDIDREAIARYGIHIRSVQDVIEVAIGGRRITTTVEGRERYPVRVRYMRELRDQIESLDKILVSGSDGAHIPLGQLAEIRYVRGPQAIKSEDTFLVGYVLFDMKPGMAEVDVVEESQRYLEAKIESGELILPAGVSYTFAGNYENQVRSQRTLSIVLPLALFIIFILLYLQFRSVRTSGLVFSGILVAWAGGFILVWLYAQPWFLDVNLFDRNMRDLFQIHPIKLSVAVWVGFLALFGIASDNGVVIATYLDQSFKASRPKTVEAIREATLAGALRRIRPCLMTTGTTLLALIPVLTSTGRGSDIMVPMAIPSFGGMLIVLVSVFLVPVLYSLSEELNLRFAATQNETR
ncbi:MAG: efflux RND transporter permease subunit [Candidatus Hydrogenedentes bacterium]|nr:efflux RND transporter permease subunit [Candidatus Hydrogenedentota bacterium]